MSPLYPVIMSLMLIALFLIIYMDVKHHKNYRLASNALLVMIFLMFVKFCIWTNSFIKNISACDTVKNLFC